MGRRWISVAEETAGYGTEASAGEEFLSFINFDVNPDQGKIWTKDSDRREKVNEIMGPFLGTGELEMNARPDAIGHLLKWAFGGCESEVIGTSAAWTHTYTIAEAIKSFTLEEDRGLGLDNRILLGTLIKELTLEAPARDKVALRAGLQYQFEKLDTAQEVGSISTLRPFVFHDGSITDFNGSALASVEALRFSLINDIPDDTHDLGSRKLPEIVLQGVEPVIEMDMKFKSWAMRQYFYGAQLAGPAEPKEPQDEGRTFNLQFTFNGPPTGETEAGSEYYKLVGTLPAVSLKENPSPIAGRDRLTQRVTMEALYNAGNKLELVNLIESY